MKIVLGIGNPGPEYESTRHNVGFEAIDALAGRLQATRFRRRFESLAAETRCRGERVLLLKPQTYVNETGRALRQAVDWLGSALDDILVVVDDYRLPLGALRIRRGGSAGGHRGLESVERHLGSDRVPRLRIGIGNERQDVGKDFVLSRFEPGEREAAAEAVQRAVEATTLWMEEGIERCMNLFNAKKRVREDRDEKEESV